MKYAASTGGFYHPDIHEEIPEDAVDVSDERYQELLEGQSAGRRIIADEHGNPVLADQLPLDRSDIEHMRLAAYADPINGSDRLFSEAYRMQLMDEPGWEAIRDAGIARYLEIKSQYPWP